MTGGPVFEVLDGGLLSTIQDAGRPGFGALGVPRAGVCDPTALAIANILAGNPPDAPVIECTLTGPELLALRDVVVSLAGADLGAVAQPGGRRLETGASHRLAAGERLALGGGPATGGPSDAAGSPGAGGTGGTGCRAYLAVPGGFAMPDVLGSASTSLVGGFGGFEGRALRGGDRLASGDLDDGSPRPTHRRWPADLRFARLDDGLAVLAGPAADHPAGRAALEVLVTTTWRVASASDRRGLRLEGPALELDVPSDAPSHGVPTGTVQVTPSGQPIVLLQDAGPTGGYPVLAVVATADLSLAGQARPGATLRFRVVGQDAARAAERERREALLAGAARLLVTDPWDDLPGMAGA